MEAGCFDAKKESLSAALENAETTEEEGEEGEEAEDAEASRYNLYLYHFVYIEIKKNEIER